MTDRQALLDQIYEDYARIPVLGKLAAGRPLVRGAGPLTTPLVVVGEAPGEEEERAGEPFVGPSGKMMRRLFKRAGLPWELCYRTNVVPWRPPANRTPYPYEIANSAGRLAAEIAAIAPITVLAVGSVAWDCLVSGDTGLGTASENRGRLIIDERLPWRLLGIYHPGYLMRIRGRDRDNLEDDTVAALRSIMEAPVG